MGNARGRGPGTAGPERLGSFAYETRFAYETQPETLSRSIGPELPSSCLMSLSGHRRGGIWTIKFIIQMVAAFSRRSFACD